MFKSGDWAGQVTPGISFLIFQSHVNLELCAGDALSSWKNKRLLHEMFRYNWPRMRNLCVLLGINISINWYQSSYIIIRYAAPIHSRYSWTTSSFAEAFRQPNFIWFSILHTCFRRDLTQLESHPRILQTSIFPKPVSQIKPSNCFRRVEKFVLPSTFDTGLSSFMMSNLLSSIKSVEWKNVIF